MKARIDWINKFQIKGETETGFTIMMDSKASPEPMIGPLPKELILQSLAGCTMMDVALILEKSRKHVDKFWIDVEGEICQQHPKVFTKIHLTYHFEGEDLDDIIVKRAIDLSRENYCAVSNMLKNSVEITHSYEIINKNVKTEIINK
jgi:putative redox protein